MSSYHTSHLPADRLENFIDGLSGPEPSSMERDHVAMCSRCQQKLSQLEQMHALIAELPDIAPSPGFRSAVMSRVSLPASSSGAPINEELPFQALWVSLLLIFPAAGGLYWGLHQVGWLEKLTAPVLDQAAGWAWAMFLDAGRWFWEAGLLQLVLRWAGSIQPIELAGMGATLFGLASLSVLVIYRLAALPPPTAVMERVQ